MAIEDFTKKLVLVTGAASGIGRATAVAFAAAGADIVACDLKTSPLLDLKDDVQRLGRTCEIYTADVSDEQAVREMADDVHFRLGPVHVLVPNAGIGYLGPFLESDLAHWQRLLGVNLMGVVHTCYFFLPKMIGAGDARHVAVVASAAAHYPPPSVAAYAASKSAVFAFAETLKMELTGTKVRVTTVCPGIINTAIVAPSSAFVSPAVSDAQKKRLQAYYASRGVPPETVANAIVKAVREGVDVLDVGPAAKSSALLRRLGLGLARKLSYREAQRIGYRP